MSVINIFHQADFTSPPRARLMSIPYPVLDLEHGNENENDEKVRDDSKQALTK